MLTHCPDLVAQLNDIAAKINQRPEPDDIRRLVIKAFKIIYSHKRDDHKSLIDPTFLEV